MYYVNVIFLVVYQTVQGIKILRHKCILIDEYQIYKIDTNYDILI